MQKAKGAPTTNAVAPSLPPIFPPESAISETATVFSDRHELAQEKEDAPAYNSVLPQLSDAAPVSNLVPAVTSDTRSERGIAKPVEARTFSLEEPPKRITPDSNLNAGTPERKNFEPPETTNSQSELRQSKISPHLETPAAATHEIYLSQKVASGNESHAFEPRPAASEAGILETAEAVRHGDGGEPSGQRQISRNESIVGQAPSTVPEETSVQVRIGRIEIRAAARVQTSEPPMPRPKLPRGFAGYEAVRRYATRNRM
jgi:hypothetical protein